MKHVYAVLLAAAALAGCQLDAEVRVVGDGPRPGFVVTYDRGETACIQGLTVSDVSGGVRRNVWAIRRIDARTKASCAGTVTFGVAPAGYEVAVAAAGSLVPGRRYQVNASGAGWQARAPLVVR